MNNAQPARVRRTSVAVAVAFVLALLLSACGQAAPAAGPNGEPILPGARANSHVLDRVGPQAPTLVEFVDLECESCGAMYPVVEELRQHYAGKINFVVRYFPLGGHFNSMNAALAVEAAAQQGRMEDMIGKLFENQTKWGEKKVSEAALFRSYAQELGLDLNAYDSAIASPATKARIEEDSNDGKKMGVTGTPTFFLNGKKLELRRLTDLTDPIDKAIASGTTR